jgi:hypothetical protein
MSYRLHQRVMSSGFYVLQQLYVRIDRVLYRLFETRVYRSFQDNYAIREYTERELDTEALNQLLSAQKLDLTHVLQAEELSAILLLPGYLSVDLLLDDE